MKLRKNRWLGLAFAPALLALIGFASPAEAADYTGTCAAYPGTFTGTGNIIINQATACTLPSAVSASGTISITAPSITSNVGAMSGSSVTLTSTAGAISTNKALSSTAGIVSLTSTGGNISAAAITATGNNLTINSAGALTLTGVARSTTGSVTMNAVNNIQTKRVTAGTSLQVTSSSGTVTHNGGTATSAALLSSNGLMVINSNGLLTITGTTKSPKNNLRLLAKSDLKADAVSAGAHLQVLSTNGKVNLTSTVDTNTNATGGNALIQAFANVATGTINTHGAAFNGAIEIDANTGSATATPFVIGGTGNANGVNGQILNNSTTAGGTDLVYVKQGFFLTNGNASATGGIQVTNSTDIQTLASASKAGAILLDARLGPLTLPVAAGSTLSVNGFGSTQPAGQIFLLAGTVNFGVNTLVSASQGQSVIGNSHGVTIAAQTVNHQGGLGILADGSGAGPTFPAYSYIFPLGSVKFTYNNSDYTNLTITPDISGVQGTNKPVSIVGAGGSTLLMSANGNDSAVNIRGNGVTVIGGNITLRAKGRTNHSIVLQDTVANDTSGLILGTASTNVFLDATGDGAAGGTATVTGGDIKINFDQLTYNAAGYTIDASGPASGDGAGGTIYVASRLASTVNSALVNLIADGPGSGQGNAATGSRKAIQFYPGPVNVTFGNTFGAGQYSLSAKGGTSGGNGGDIVTSSFPVTLDAPKAIDASARASATNSGDGGSITINSVINTPITLGVTVEATGKGTGKGGTFTAPFVFSAFDYRGVVKVDGGDSSDVTTIDGKMVINGVTCGQWKIGIGPGPGNTSWPRTFWDCVNPTAPTTFDNVPASFANDPVLNAIKPAFETNAVQLYVFNNQVDFEAFFKTTIGVQAAGYTDKLGPGNQIYSSVFENANGSPLTTKNLTEVTAHELGHAIGVIKGNPANDPIYASSFVERDFINLDYTVIGTDAASSIPRLPCSSNASAPFDGVKSESNAFICDPVTHSLAPQYAGMRNSKIAKTASPGIFKWYGGTAGWRELYPQAMAFESYVAPKALGSTEYYFFTPSGLWNSGAPSAGFQCSLGWAAATLANQSTPPVITGCTAVPGWYQTQLRTDLQ